MGFTKDKIECTDTRVFVLKYNFSSKNGLLNSELLKDIKDICSSCVNFLTFFSYNRTQLKEKIEKNEIDKLQAIEDCNVIKQR